MNTTHVSAAPPQRASPAPDPMDAAVKFLRFVPGQISVKMKYLRERHHLTQAQVEATLLLAHAPPSEAPPASAAETTAAVAAATAETSMVGFYKNAHILFDEREPVLADFYSHGRRTANVVADAAAHAARSARVSAMESNRNFVKSRAQTPAFLVAKADEIKTKGIQLYQAGKLLEAMDAFRDAMSKNPKLSQLLSYTSTYLLGDI